MSTGQSKYDALLNPCYQIDWQNSASGKRVAATKRRVRWRFGFSNREAIAKGLTGIECRGEEHEVTLVWSLTSGKRLVIADGREVHFSHGNRLDSKFETSWTMQGGHILKLIAHAAPPLYVPPGFKQFDLLLDGCSYFSMPRIFELGTPRANKFAIVPKKNSNPKAYTNYSLPPNVVSPSHSQRSADERRSSRSSSAGSNDFAQPPSPRDKAEPMDLLSDPTGGQDYLDTTAPQNTQSVDTFAPVEATTQPPSYQAVSNQILTQYGPPQTSAYPALANESHTYYAPQPQQQTYQPQQNHAYYTPQQTYQQHGYQQQPVYHQQPQYAQNAAVVSPDSSMRDEDPGQEVGREQPPSPVALTMEPLSIEEMEARRQPPMSEMERAMKSLVNLEDISETLKTPEQRKVEESKKKNRPNRSEPLPPTAPEWHLGLNPKLGEIKEYAPAKSAPKKEIMRTHAFDPAAAAAGMMVVYGATSVQQQQQYQYYGHHSQQQPVYASYY